MVRSNPKYPTDATRTVAVDVDGVLATTPEFAQLDCFGEVIDGAVEFTHRLAERFYVVIYSAGTSEVTWPGVPMATLKRIMLEWLELHGFAFDEIYTGRGKPPAIAYVDDRGVSCRPEDIGLRAFDDALEAVEFLASTV